MVNVLGVKKGFKGVIPDTPPNLDRDSERDANDKRKQEMMRIKEAMKNSVDLNEAIKGSSNHKNLFRDIDFNKLVPRDRRSHSLIPGYMQYLGQGPYNRVATDKMLM